ncbi:hypothetical protein [Paenibacillus chitinolyticus]|uniref:DUF2642 domain-containing protein n=1 Tax=Paenibacillus chitinolyticus TaxID=79263 RepID=A0ABT4FHX7_9BACL|nr:hypothetical protein [Paenibacillus chitinolyticus]MCY9589889.1 hypothetical protein [Paenibacillus chitinolyticus]MCY9598110.1 hypothetical protein [Paenibacillus chitinolyticus]
MSKEYHLTTTRRVPLKTQRRIRNISPGLVGKVVVVRTLFNTFTGCLLSIRGNTIRLRIFSGIDRVFITIRIPIGIILDIFRFPCP